MAAQFCFIMHAAQAEPLERATHGSRDGLSQAGFPDTWRADQAENRRLGRRIQFQYRQMFDDPFLYFLNAVVVVFEDLTHFTQFQLIFRGLLPGKFQHQIEIRSEDLMVRRGGWHLRQSGDFPLHFLAHMIWKIGVLNLLFQFGDLVSFSLALAEFILNRLELFTEDILSLALADLGLSVVGDFFPQLQYLDFL